MIFKPATRQLFSDDVEFIKTMFCPHNVKWDELAQADGTKNRTCLICQKSITDTENHTDHEILDLVRKTPEICLKIHPNQKNIKVIVQYDHRNK